MKVADGSCGLDTWWGILNRCPTQSFCLISLDFLLGPTFATPVAVVTSLGEDYNGADDCQQRGNSHSYGEILLDLPGLGLNARLTVLLA